MEEAIGANLGMMIDGEIQLNAVADFDMTNLDSAAQPADIKKAQQFRNETCIRKFENGAYLHYSVCSTSLKQLGEYGVGIELYFKLIKYLGILFFIISGISIYPIYTNSNGSGLTAGDIRQRWDAWSISNTDWVEEDNEFNDNEQTLFWLFISDAIYTGVFIIFIVIFQVLSSRTISSNFRKNITLADFAIEVKGLPSEGIDKKHVAEHFHQFGTVVEVYLARAYDGVLAAYKERATLSYELAYLRLLESRGEKNPKKIEKIIQKMKKFDLKIEESERNSDKTNDELPVIRAFVVFSNVGEKKKCLTVYEKAKGCCKSRNKQRSELKLQGIYPLKVQSTAAPTNILFENIEVTKCSRFIRRVISFIAVIIALIASIAMIYALKMYQDELPANSECDGINSNSSLSEAESLYTSDTQVYCYCKKQSISSIINDSDMFDYCTYFIEKISYSVTLRVSVSIGVIFVNFVLKIIFRVLTRFEKVSNKSAEQLKLMSKVFFATFINTALVILAVNADFSELKTYDWLPKFIFNSDFEDFSRQWYVQVGSTIVSTMLIMIFSPHCVLLLTFYPLGLCKRHCCTGKYKAQREANEKFAGAEFDLATRNSFVLTVVFTCFLYSGGMPILNVVCFLTMFVLYWVDKFLILNHYSKPPMYNHLLHERVLHYLPFAVIFHCGFSLYMYGASDIFPKSFDSSGYDYTINTLGDRIKQISGFVNIILAGAALSTSFWVYSYAKIFSCIMKKKVIDDQDDKEAQGSISQEFINIRRHGLDSYDIMKNPNYRDLILAMNAAANNVKKNRDNSRLTSHPL